MIKKPIKIEVETSKRIFCFYALLNVLGYNPENHPTNPVRQKVRTFLKKSLANSKKPLTNIKNLTKQPNINREFYFPLRNWVLCHGQPATFKELSPYWKQFLSIQDGKEFANALRVFWKIGKLSSVWERTKTDYLKIKKQCLFNAKSAVENSINYLRLKDKDVGFDKFVVIPNFLDEYNRGIGPKIDNVAYSILGPSKDKNNDKFSKQRIEHEFLHSVINPITKEIFKDKVSNSELSLVRESLIQTMVLRINKSNQAYYQSKLERLKQKYKNIEKILSLLEEYENQKDDFKTFLSKKHSTTCIKP